MAVEKDLRGANSSLEGKSLTRKQHAHGWSKKYTI
jgi:hypothetical protein